jgi:hypothetical protein
MQCTQLHFLRSVKPLVQCGVQCIYLDVLITSFSDLPSENFARSTES